MGGAVFEDAANLVAADLRASRASAKALETRAVETQAAIDKLPDLSRASALLDEAERLSAVADAAVIRRTRLTTIINHYRRASAEVTARGDVVHILRSTVEAAGFAVQNVANCVQVHALCTAFVQRSEQIGMLRRVIACAGADLDNAEHLMERAVRHAHLRELHQRQVSAHQRANQLDGAVAAERTKLSSVAKLLDAATTSLGTTTTSTQRVELLITLKNRLLRYTSAVTTETTLLGTLQKAVEDQAAGFEQALRSAGHCPLCGSDTAQVKVA